MDDYCDVCFSAQHRKGSRKKHAAKALAAGEKAPSKPSQNGVAHTEPNGQEVRRPSCPFHTTLTPEAGGDGRWRSGRRGGCCLSVGADLRHRSQLTTSSGLGPRRVVCRASEIHTFTLDARGAQVLAPARCSAASFRIHRQNRYDGLWPQQGEAHRTSDPRALRDSLRPRPCRRLQAGPRALH